MHGPGLSWHRQRPTLAGAARYPGRRRDVRVKLRDHDREVCRILDRRLAQANPDSYQIDSVITEVATRGGFNYDTAGFVIGAAMASACRQHVEQFEAALGQEIA